MFPVTFIFPRPLLSFLAEISATWQHCTAGEKGGGLAGEGDSDLSARNFKKDTEKLG
jgi:hypothetical protein